MVCVLPALGSISLKVQAPYGYPIGVGDKFYIVYTLTNPKGEPQKPPSIPGGRVNYFTLSSQQSSYTSINGHATQSVTYVYTATCLAEKPGSYTFGPVTAGGETSNKVTYNIVSATDARHQRSQSQGNSAQSQQSSGSTLDPYATARGNQEGPKFIGKGNDKLFLRASLNKTIAYEQEALVYTVKLYSTYSTIKFIGSTEAPKFDGFVIEESDDVSKSLTYERYNGREYATAVIARYIIFPQETGELKIKGNTYTISTDELEYYQDPYYSTMAVRRPIQLNVSPNDLSVSVKPLPTPQPADFSGGVGNFSISSSLPSAALKANQAGSIVYTVTGTGNLQYIHLPDLAEIYPKQIDVAAPEVKVEAKTGALNVSGSVSYDCPFLPLEPGDYTLPDLTLTYFNPSTGKYEKSVATGYRVTVGQGEESAKSQNRGLKSLDTELMPLGKMTFSTVPYIARPLYWLLGYLLPLAVLGAVAWFNRKIIARKADEMGTRSRRAGRTAAKRLRRAARALKANSPDAFYTEMLKALWGYVADKLRIPTSELNRENVAAKLEVAGVSEQLAQEFLTCVDDCEFARYTPSASGLQAMHTLYGRTSENIEALESSFRKIKKTAPSLGHP